MEIVKGPGKLLYGGSAVGGVVNAISRHHAVHEPPHQGTRGFISGSGGSANGFASGSAGVEYGQGKWMVWGGGAGQSSGEYTTPEGMVSNSDTKLWNGYAGFGRYGERSHFSVNAGYDDATYGVPFANEFHGRGHEEEHPEEEVGRTELDARRQSYQLHWGLRKPGPVVESFSLRLGYSRWLHNEIEVAEDGARTTGTEFGNNQLTYRGTFEQAERGRLSGRFGLWGMVRNFSASGEEALSPPVDQQAIAGYVLEEVDLERVKLQCGARVEHNNYDPDLSHSEEGHARADLEPTEAYPRSFTGGSAAAGVNIGLWRGGAFVANYTHSHRPPAMEELYNFGPHVGNLAFELGDPALGAEKRNGLDLSLRHKRERFRMEGNFFYYDFDNFIFPFATGEVEDGLRVIKFIQADTRYMGAEFNTDLKLHEDLWLNLGVDYVNAQEKRTQTSLPRIAPLRGRVGFDWHWKGLEVRPELILADRQGRTFIGESETAGYAVANLKASYTFNRGQFIHQFALNTFNIGDTLYRNHSSFIKDLAPEIGRGIRFTYRVRFF